MTITAFVLILCSVFLHVGWNFLCKVNKNPTIAFYVVANLFAAVLLVPLLFFMKVEWCAIGMRFWLAALSSGFFEAIYSIGLFKAYGRNDISLAYPMARALPVLMIPIVTLLFQIGSIPTGLALVGVVVVAAGCMIMPQNRFSDISWRMLFTASMVPIAIAATGTTGYTIMDNMGTALLIELANSSRIVTLCAYYCIVLIIMVLFLLVYMLATDWGCVCREICTDLKASGAYLCGLFSLLAYLLVLGAMGFVSNVSYLQAFRQLSLPLGVLAGVYFLKERLTAPKIVGTVMIVIGLVLMVIK